MGEVSPSFQTASSKEAVFHYPLFDVILYFGAAASIALSNPL
jgi:hypothetical protein